MLSLSGEPAGEPTGEPTGESGLSGGPAGEPTGGLGHPENILSLSGEPTGESQEILQEILQECQVILRIC
jgi:hypothetical protein